MLFVVKIVGVLLFMLKLSVKLGRFVSVVVVFGGVMNVNVIVVGLSVMEFDCFYLV